MRALKPGPSDGDSEPGPSDGASEPGPSDGASEPGPSDGASEAGPSDGDSEPGPSDGDRWPRQRVNAMCSPAFPTLAPPHPICAYTPNTHTHTAYAYIGRCPTSAP